MNQKQTFLDFLESSKTINPESSPDFRLMVLLHKAFKEEFTDAEASKIVGAMKINVNQEFMDDPELRDKTIKVYAGSIVKLKNAFSKVSPTLFWESIKNNPPLIKYEG